MGGHNNFLDITALGIEQSPEASQQGVESQAKPGAIDQQSLMEKYNQFLNEKIQEVMNREHDVNEEIWKAKHQGIVEEPIFFVPDKFEEVYARLKTEELKICSITKGEWVVGSHPVEKMKLDSIELYFAKY